MTNNQIIAKAALELLNKELKREHVGLDTLETLLVKNLIDLLSIKNNIALETAYEENDLDFLKSELLKIANNT